MKYEAKRILASQITNRFQITVYTFTVISDYGLLSSFPNHVGFPDPALQTLYFFI